MALHPGGSGASGRVAYVPRPVLYLSPHRRPNTQWDSSTGVTVTGDTRYGVPFKWDCAVFAYLGTLAYEKGQHVAIAPADVRGFLGVRWSDGDICARIIRVAHSAYKMPERLRACSCSDEECQGARRSIGVSDDAYVCSATGRIHISFTSEFLTEARSGAQLDIEMVRHLAMSPAVLSFVVAVWFLGDQGTAAELVLLGDHGIRDLMQLPDSDARARQTIESHTATANGCPSGWPYDFDARSNKLVRTAAESHSEAGATRAVADVSSADVGRGDARGPGGSDGQGDARGPGAAYAAPPGGHSRPGAPACSPSAHDGPAGGARQPGAGSSPASAGGSVLHRAMSQEGREDLDRWLSAALTGDLEPRPTRPSVPESPPWVTNGDPASPGTSTRARGRPPPPTATEAESAAATSVMALTGMMCALGFLPAMRGPTAQGWRRAVSRPSAQDRGSPGPRPPTAPGIVKEIDGLRFIDGVLVSAPWFNKRRASPPEPRQTPTQRNPDREPAGPDPPLTDEPDTS